MSSVLRRIPKCLRRLSIWFVTESGEPRSVHFSRYSASTFQPLQYFRAEDYTSLDIAIQAWQDHQHWFDGVAFRVTNPWVVLVIQGCLTPGGGVTKRVRDVIGRVGGYWEYTRNRKDIQGFLWWPQHQESFAAVIAGYRAFLCGEGVCAVTGHGIAGFTGDPLQTDQDSFSIVLRDMAISPAIVFQRSLF